MTLSNGSGRSFGISLSFGLDRLEVTLEKRAPPPAARYET
jgi:hypothetical protein